MTSTWSENILWPIETVGRKRVDILLVERGLAETRERAQALILAGEVLLGDRAVPKPGVLVDEAAVLQVRQPLPYVSRGGEKLAAALDCFGLQVGGLTGLDVGASTGGFTDCLLQRGARQVYAVDVGYGQLDWRLRQDPRVVVLEKTNIRYLESLPEPVDFAVVDVSFISLILVLPAVRRLLRPGGWVVALIKPQFEAGRQQVSRGGVVRDPAVHREVLERLCGWAAANGWTLGGLCPSPLLGPAGNREFFALLRTEGQGIDLQATIEQCLAVGSAAAEQTT